MINNQTKRRWVAGLMILAGMAGAAKGTEPLNELLPEETLAFLEIDPAHFVNNGGAADSLAMLDAGMAALQQSGVLPRQASVVGDVISLAAVAGANRSCMALLDADLKVTPEGGLICNSVQVAWVIDTGGDAGAMVGKLTRLLHDFSTRPTARQSVKKGENGGEYVEFFDTNWPEWFKLAWTQQDHAFVLTFGDGAMERYLAKRKSPKPMWSGTIAGVDAEASHLGSIGEPFARLHVSVSEFQLRFPEAMERTVLGRLFSALQWNGRESEVLTARLSGRAMAMDDGFRTAGASRRIGVTRWTADVSPDLLKLVPPEATVYAAMNMNWRTVYSEVAALLDAILTDPTDKPVSQIIRAFTQDQGVDLERDIFAHLEPLVLVHDAPPHPLRLPFMVTVAGATGGGADDHARQAIDKLFAAASKGLDDKAATRGAKGGGDFRVQLRTDPAGISYLQFGIAGPGWAWVDNRFVISWSPTAVRSVLPLLKDAVPGVFSLPK